jgi:membrane protease YdiL (CAAX protease family)
MEKLDRRDFRFIAVCLLVIAAGAAVTSVLFRRAFPEASIKFEVDRGGARVVAEKLLRERGRDIAGARFAGEFSVDETAKVYLERELGLERAGKIYGREAKIWRWRMRWFRSGVKEEEYVTVSPLGELIGFESVQKEDAPGARLSEADARAIALRFLSSRQLPESALKPIEATPVSRPNRTDWTFVDEKAGVRFADATVRYATTVAGDRVIAFSEFMRVPEAWTRDYQKLRSKNEAAGQIATFALFATLIAMLAVLVRKIVLKDVPWKLVGAFGGVAFVLALLSMVNGLPSTLWGYDTASPLSAFLAEQLVRGVLGAVATGAGIAIVVAAAEPIYRERFPRQFSLGGAFSLRGIQTKAFLRSVLLGYALVAFFFAYQATFYVVAGHFGAWSPAEVPYDDMLNTALPWATVLLIGFLPAVTEEGISRMFSISFLDRLGAGRVLAVVVPAFIWGFGHSTYPNQPFFIRGLEVGVAGVVMGFLMLRYGVVPLLVWHFTVDALYTALVLLRSGNSYYVISGAVAAGILLLPLLGSLVMFARRGGFLPAAGLTNGERGFVAEPTDVAAPATLVPDVRPLSRGARGATVVAALALLSSFFVATHSDPPLVEDATGRAAAEALARRFLVVNGVDLEPWTSVAYTGTGFTYDESLRAARPQDAAGIPGFSYDAARYVIAQGGPSAFRKLAERQLPLAYWVVRFFQPEKKEEWKVLIDARRGRVVAFVNPVGEDAAAAPPLSGEDARRRAAEVAGKLGYPAAEYAVLEVGTEARPKRVDTTVVLESKPAGIGQARPRLTAVFHGPRLSSFLPSIQIPESFMREQRKRSSGEVVLTSLRVVAGGALVGLAIILFLRRVREPDFRWRSLGRPLVVAGLLGAASLANTWPSIFRQYDTEKPMGLFRVGAGVSLVLSLLAILLAASVGLVLLAGARPGWGAALRRKGSLADALLRAAIAAAGLAGLSRWFHVVSSRVPALYDPDPSLPGSLANAVPAVDAVWAAARGAFGLAAVAAVAALAWKSAFFRSTAGRVLGVLALVVVLLPGELRAAPEFTMELLSAVLAAAWIAVCAFALLRDHAAAWALFGLFALGGRTAVDLLAQPASADVAQGGLALILLVLFGLALLAGRRDASPPAVAREPTIPSSGTA